MGGIYCLNPTYYFNARGARSFQVIIRHYYSQPALAHQPELSEASQSTRSVSRDQNEFMGTVPVWSAHVPRPSPSVAAADPCYPEQFLLARRAAFLFAHRRSRPRWPYLGLRPHFLWIWPFLPRLAPPRWGSPASKREEGSQ